MTIRLRSALAALSSLLIVLGFAVPGWFPLMWVAFVPVLFAISGTKARGAFFLGMLFGGLTAFAGYVWLAKTIEHFTQIPALLSWLLVLAVALWIGMIFAIPVFCVRLADVTWGVAPVWTLAMVYPVVEWLFPNPFPFFLGACQYPFTAITQIVDVTGMSGLSCLIALVNGAFYELLIARREARRAVPGRWVIPSAAFLLVLLYGGIRIPQIDRLVADSTKVKAALIQSNLTGDVKRASPETFLREHLALTRRALSSDPGIDWIVWPETAVHNPIPDDLADAGSLLVDKRPLLTGALVKDKEGQLRNSLISVAPNGRLIGRYDKVRLVPFSEALPFGERLSWLRRWIGRDSSFEPGSRQRNLPAGDARLLPMICYEAIMEDTVRAQWLQAGPAEALVNVANDSWFGTSHEPWMHLILASFRSIETRRAMMRCTNTGISAFIDPVGRIRERSELSEEAILIGEVPLIRDRSTTLFLKYGNWLGGTCLVISLAGAAFLWWKRRASRPRRDSVREVPSSQGDEAELIRREVSGDPGREMLVDDRAGSLVSPLAVLSCSTMNPNEPIKPRDFLSLERFFGVRVSPEDTRIILVLITAAVCLTLERFCPALSFAWYSDWLPAVSWQNRFFRLMNWATWIGLTYVLFPVLLSKLVFKEKLRHHGLKATGMRRNAGIYATAFLIVFIAVWIVSGQESFVSKYPFLPLPQSPSSDAGEWWIYFGIWEIVYFLQFCAVEYFFRGFLLFEMEKKYGFHAIFLAMIPYCMIHFEKPFLEALGSIIAGIFLGMLALRTRSIIFGMVLHCLVAASMDVAALLRKGSLPPFPWIVP